MAEKNGGGDWVSNRQLATELKAMRWEMRFLILMAGLANLGIAHILKVPGVSDATGALLSVL